MLSLNTSNNSSCDFSEADFSPLNQSHHRHNGVESPLGLEISLIQEANEDFNNPQNDALATGDQWGSPNGTHKIRSHKIIKGDGYENENGSGVCDPSSGQASDHGGCSIF